MLYDAKGQLRNGWWILIFVGLVALTRFIYKPVKLAMLDVGVPEQWLEPWSFILILTVTAICARLRRQSLAEVGFEFNGRWFGQMLVGLVLGGAAIVVTALMIWGAGAVEFQLNPERSFTTLGYGFYVFLFAALLEEALFRGFIFQRLLDGIGVWGAQILLALLFASGHWGNPDMDGITMVIATIDLALGALLLGMAYIRTGSLALPVGLHLGWNWTQGNILGFGVSGYEHAGWFSPVLQNQPVWLSGGAFGAESSIFAIVADLALLILLWRWRGTKRQSKASDAAAEIIPSSVECAR